MTLCTRYAAAKTVLESQMSKKKKINLQDGGFPKLRESATEQVRVINGSLKRADSLKDI